MDYGCWRRRIALLAICGAVFYLAACGGHLTGAPPQDVSNGNASSGDIPQGSFVAVFGDNEADLRRSVAAAQAAGMRPAYISMKTAKADHVFNVYAQMLRTSRAFVVRGFGHVYVFRLSDVQLLSYEGARLDLNTVPKIDWNSADRAALGTPGRFLYLQPYKYKLCPDCEVLILDAQVIQAQMAQWNGLIDPWQRTPNFVAWAPSPAPGTRHADGTNHCVSGPGWTHCYVYGGSYPGGAGGGGGGDSLGGGGKGTPPPIPTPDPIAGCSTRDQTAGKAFAQVNKVDPSVFNAPNPQSSSNPYGSEAYGWVYQNNSNHSFEFTAPIVKDLPSGGVIGIGNPPTYAGYTFVGWYHTHPFNPDSPQMIDSQTNNHFSPEDEAYSTTQPAYVGVDDTLSGDDNPNDAEPRWHKYDPTTKKETMMNTIGAGGC